MILATRLRALLAAAFLLLPAAGAAEVAVPPLKSRVTDLTGTLDAGEKSALEQSLAAFEAKKGAQIAVLLVPTTQPETVEQYAIRVFDQWKLGRKGIDDGALLLIAKNDRKLRIEVGYGLEGALPDAVAKRIIADDIVPRFKQNDFAGGIRAGTERMMRVLDGEALPAPAAANRSGGSAWNLDSLVAVAFFALIFVGGILRAVFGRALAAGIVGGVLGFAAWFITGTLIIALIVAVFAFVFTLAGGGSGGRWGGSSGGWSSGGGGFSGGGGSSGGGGASGSW
jgi:uncharacterized protein